LEQVQFDIESVENMHQETMVVVSARLNGLEKLWFHSWLTRTGILYGFAAASAAAAFRFARMSHRDLTEWVHIR